MRAWLLTLLAVAPLLGQASDPALRPTTTLFEGETSVVDGRGQPSPVRVKIARWILPARERIEPFPRRGFLIVELFAGDLTTVIDGKRERRVVGETFTVPARSSFGVATGDDVVSLQTIEVASRPR